MSREGRGLRCKKRRRERFLGREGCYKWVEKRCMNSTILAAILCNSVQRVIRSAPSRAGT